MTEPEHQSERQADLVERTMSLGPLVVVGLIGVGALSLGMQQAQEYLDTPPLTGAFGFWYAIGRCVERGMLEGAMAVTGLLALVGLLIRRWWALAPFVAVAAYVIGLYGGMGALPLIDRR